MAYVVVVYVPTARLFMDFVAVPDKTKLTHATLFAEHDKHTHKHAACSNSPHSRCVVHDLLFKHKHAHTQQQSQHIAIACTMYTLKRAHTHQHQRLKPPPLPLPLACSSCRRFIGVVCRLSIYTLYVCIVHTYNTYIAPYVCVCSRVVRVESLR